MLGIKKKKWEWSIFGKHPAVNDFIKIGSKDKDLSLFYQWVQNCYDKIRPEIHKDHKIHSWRFWVKSPAKGHLICGLVRDSCDKVGRSYPILIIGTGHLPGWEKNWDLLPFSCEKTWMQIESISTMRTSGIQDFQESLVLINKPISDWEKLKDKRGNPYTINDNNNNNSTSAWNLDDIECLAQSKINEEYFIEPIKLISLEHSFIMIEKWHYILKKFNHKPGSIFMGGISDKLYIAVFNRSLKSDDFNQLWSI